MNRTTPKFDLSSGKKSTGAALLFSLILIMGMIWLFNDPPGDSFDKQKEVVSTEKINHKDTSPTYGWYFFKMILITSSFVIFIILGLKFYKKKYIQFGNRPGMTVLKKHYLSTKQYLMEIEIENEKLLIGVTDHNITLLKEYKNHDTEPVADSSFGTVLKKNKGR